MKYHSPKTLTLIISLAAYLCSFPGLGNAAIVCFGDDGHVSIESTPIPSLPVQNTSVTEHGFEIEHDNHCENQCSSCIDFPLSFTTANQNLYQHKYEFKLAKNSLFRQNTNIAYIAGADTSHSFPPSQNPPAVNTIISLRTIVLLI